MKEALGSILAVCVLLSAVPGSADDLFDWYGWSDFPEVEGGVLVQVGFVVEIWNPLTYDPSLQYTYAFEGMQLIEMSPMGASTRYDYAGGFFNVYEDASFNAIHDAVNCLLTSGSTFTDGTLYLQAEVDELTWIVNNYTGEGGFSGTVAYVGGTHLYEIPPASRGGTVFGGSTDGPVACIPENYIHRWDGQAFTIVPTAAEEDNWGSLKSLYR